MKTKALKAGKKIRYVLMSSAKDGELFYCKLGRFFCSKRVTDEMGGYQVVDDESRIWVVAFDGDIAIGFCSFSTARAEKRIVDLCDSYVDPSYRKLGIYGEMFKLRDKQAEGWLPDGGTIKGIAMQVSEKVFLANGYHKASQRGRFAYMVREVAK